MIETAKTVKIDKKIVDATTVNVLPYSELVERPEELQGSTYKIKPSYSEHSYYIIINDIVIEDRRVPFEIFIKSKNVEGMHYLNAIMLLISASLRENCNKKNGSQFFLIRQLKSAIDYSGPYYLKGGKKYNSFVAHIAEVLEKHFNRLGIFGQEKPSVKKTVMEDNVRGLHCASCGASAVVSVNGCKSCTECGAGACS